MRNEKEKQEKNRADVLLIGCENETTKQLWLREFPYAKKGKTYLSCLNIFLHFTP